MVIYTYNIVVIIISCITTITIILILILILCCIGRHDSFVCTSLRYTYFILLSRDTIIFIISVFIFICNFINIILQLIVLANVPSSSPAQLTLLTLLYFLSFHLTTCHCLLLIFHLLDQLLFLGNTPQVQFILTSPFFKSL